MTPQETADLETAVRLALEPLILALLAWRQGRRHGDNEHDDKLIEVIDDFEPRLDELIAAFEQRVATLEQEAVALGKLP